ncbi:MAG TPA: metal-sulfur cluster assembly factor [Xanthobacteraceae bacterium]
MNERDILQALEAVIDPELGINIVDLGLVSRTSFQDDTIEVALTPSTPSCPLTEIIVEEVRDALRARFPEAADVRVDLVWDPPWSPDRVSKIARRQLGLTKA